MSEPFDSEVELAQYFGQDPKERIDELTRLQPVKEGSRCTNDPLQIALAQHFRERKRIEFAAAEAQERKAYALVKQAEEHLARVTEFWNNCATTMWALKEECDEPN